MKATLDTPRKKPSGPSADDPAVILTFEDLALLGRVMRRNVASKEELFAAITDLNTMSVEGVPVTLEPRLLQRLRSRCLHKENWREWLTEVVTKQLHDYAGW